MAMIRIFLNNGWRNSSMYVKSLDGKSEFLGAYMAIKEGGQFHVDVSNLWVARIPDWVKEVGKEFSIRAYVSLSIERDGMTFMYRSARAFVEFANTKGVHVSISGTVAQDVRDLYLQICDGTAVRFINRPVPEPRPAPRKLGKSRRLRRKFGYNKR